MAGACKVTVEKGAEITAPTGIEVRAGSLTVNGGKITAKAALNTSTSNGNGTSTHGAGIGVAQHVTKLPISVTANDEKNLIARDDDAKGMPITVTGGTFSGDVADYVAPDAVYVEGSAFYAVGKEAKALVENAKDGDTLTLFRYDSEITVPEGVVIENETGGKIEVNGQEIVD